MKISLDLPSAHYFVRSYEPGCLILNDSPFEQAIAVHKETVIDNLAISHVNELTQAHISRFIALKPNVVILGTGPKQEFPDKYIIKQFINTQIGVEMMDTHAACRTYNILAQDDRNVLGIFIL